MRHVGRAGAEPIELHAALLDGFELPLERLVGRSAAGAEHADVGELAGVVVGRRHGVAAAHRETGNRAVVLYREDAVALLDERNHVLHETLRVRAFVRLRLSATFATRTTGARSRAGLLLRLHGRRRGRDDLLTRRRRS